MTIAKEQTIFPHVGNTILTPDREVRVIARIEDPLVVVLGNMLSDEECDEMIRLSKHRMDRSKIGASGAVHDLRTSSGTFLEEGETEAIARIERRVSYVMGIPAEHAEGLQVLHYRVGQEYKAHFDFFTSAATSNPRISTLVMYLNDVEQGGETVFPKLNLSVCPHKGMAVYFEYFYDDDNVNALTLHGGAPIVRGEKWAATQWMHRQRISGNR